MLRDFAIALSLANLQFFAIWADLLPGAPAHYFMEQPPPPFAYTAAWSNVLLAAAVFWCAARLVRRVNLPVATGVAQLAFLAAVVLALNSLRLKMPIVVPMIGQMKELFGQTTVLAVLTLALLWWRRTAFRVAVGLVLVMAPFTLVTLGRASWTWIRHDTTFADFASQEPAAMLNADAPVNRVLWLVFDELDERLTFENRPIGVDLPEFDRLSRGSIVATNAYPPANDTLRSMPALITGRSVAEAHPLQADELLMRFAGSRSDVRWGGEENIFTRARAAGVNSGLVGSYHPYCRVIGQVLATCAWQQWRRDVWLSAPATMLNQNFQVLEMMPGAKRIGLIRWLRTLTLPSYGQTRRSLAIQAYQAALADVKRVANRRDLGLILVHLPVPHAPYIYRRETGEFVRSGYGTYFDNLVLADRALGEIRRTMEDAGTWDATSILVTADHGYRTELWRNKIPHDGEEARAVAGRVDERVPFLLKLAGQTIAVKYSTRLNTVTTHDLLLALLRGEVAGVDSVLLWMEAQPVPETTSLAERS